ncbi:MAG: protein-arginine deiminase family protein [Bythopirellula sp.]|nr:protein-arginine deiminase family protein [Bythopirellula sp.]
MRIAPLLFCGWLCLQPNFLVAAQVLQLTADTDRNGQLESAKDDQDEETWTNSHGAVVLVNCDDDDRDGNRDFEDEAINGAEDRLDLAPLLLESLADLPADSRVTVSLQAPTEKAFLHVPEDQAFRCIPAGESWEFAASELGTEGIEFFVEAAAIADKEWDGSILVAAKLLDNTSAESGDEVRLRVAPLVAVPSIAPATHIFVREFPGRNEALLTGLKSVAKESNSELVIIPGGGPYADNHIWLQDAVEFFYSQTPRSRIDVALPANRNQAVDMFASDRLLGPGFGFVRVGTYREKFALGEGGVSWIDWYGNLEVTPPVEDHPWGRLLYGIDREHEAQLNPEVVATLAAQGLQEPLALDVGWLVIKHADEMLAFVPSSDPKIPFYVLVPDTTLALDLLANLQKSGKGDLPLFGTYEKDVTVDSLLAEAGFAESNRKLQVERIDPMIDSLVAGLKLDPSQIVRLPALFNGGGLSRMPNMVNCLVANGHLAMADPNGPLVDGEDAFQRDVRQRLAKLPVTIHFVDDQQYHRWSGNVHCATNALRKPIADEWWNAAKPADDK